MVESQAHAEGRQERKSFVRHHEKRNINNDKIKSVWKLSTDLCYKFNICIIKKNIVIEISKFAYLLLKQKGDRGGEAGGG